MNNTTTYFTSSDIQKRLLWDNEKQKLKIVMYILTVCALNTQVYLIFLVQYKSPQAIREYRFWLNMFTFWDISFTLCMGLLLPSPFYNADKMFPPGIAGISSIGLVNEFIGPCSTILTCAGAFYSGTNMLIIQCNSLIYRYLVVKPEQRLYRWFIRKAVKLIVLLLDQLISIYMSTILYHSMRKQEQIQKDFDEWPQEKATFDKYLKIEHFVLSVVLNENQTMVLVLVLSVIIGSLFAFTFSSTMIYLTLRVLKNHVQVFTTNTYRLHRQLIMLLTVQLILPVIFITIPISYLVFCALFIIPIPDRALGLIYVLWSMYGFANSTMTILFAGAYRQHTAKVFIRPWLHPLIDLFRLRRVLPGLHVDDNITTALNNRTSNQQPSVAQNNLT